jgi:hypothetical protein
MFECRRLEAMSIKPDAHFLHSNREIVVMEMNEYRVHAVGPNAKAGARATPLAGGRRCLSAVSAWAEPLLTMGGL